MLSIFCSPSRYTQGRGATAALGCEMAALGLAGPALLIASKTVIARLATTWKSSLNEVGIQHAIHTFGGECSPAEIENIKSTVRRCTSLAIIGAGGGKVIDTCASCRCRFGPTRNKLPNRCLKRCPLQCAFRHLHG